MERIPLVEGDTAQSGCGVLECGYGRPPRGGIDHPRPFCETCDRIRLTADGQLRKCQFAREESDLRTALRAGATDAELAVRMQAAVRSKKAGHGIDDPDFLQPDRPMSAIGG